MLLLVTAADWVAHFYVKSSLSESGANALVPVMLVRRRGSICSIVLRTQYTVHTAMQDDFTFPRGKGS